MRENLWSEAPERIFQMNQANLPSESPERIFRANLPSESPKRIPRANGQPPEQTPERTTRPSLKSSERTRNTTRWVFWKENNTETQCRENLPSETSEWTNKGPSERPERTNHPPSERPEWTNNGPSEPTTPSPRANPLREPPGPGTPRKTPKRPCNPTPAPPARNELCLAPQAPRVSWWKNFSWLVESVEDFRKVSCQISWKLKDENQEKNCQIFATFFAHVGEKFARISLSGFFGITLLANTIIRKRHNSQNIFVKCKCTFVCNTTWFWVKTPCIP